jgi:hypothetical protein
MSSLRSAAKRSSDPYTVEASINAVTVLNCSLKFGGILHIINRKENCNPPHPHPPTVDSLLKQNSITTPFYNLKYFIGRRMVYSTVKLICIGKRENKKITVLHAIVASSWQNFPARPAGNSVAEGKIILLIIFKNLSFLKSFHDPFFTKSAADLSGSSKFSKSPFVMRPNNQPIGNTAVHAGIFISDVQVPHK